ncbi:MAG: hypothetical protein ABIS27_05620 [Longimicrobiales bacterium]
MKQPTPRVLCLAFIIALTACTTGKQASSESITAAAPNDVAISISGHTFQAPDTIDAGWTTVHFANNGDDIHYAHFVRLDSGKTVPELVQAYAEAIRTSGPRPKWVVRFGGPGGAAPSDSSAVTQNLEPGSYVLICPVEDSAGKPHFGNGEVKALVVRTAKADLAGQASAPTATMSIHLNDYAFGFDAPPMAGQHMIRVDNAGQQPHDVVLLKLAPGKTLNDVRMTMNPERARRPDEKNQPEMSMASLATMGGGIAVIRPGMEVFFKMNLIPGEYALVCMTTAPDGRSHIEHGMIQQMRIE